MDDAQVDRERHEVEAEWRAGFHAFGHRRQRSAAAARARAGIAFDTGDDGLDRWQVDLVVALRETLIRIRQRGMAVQTVCWLCDHRLVGVLRQRTATTVAAKATLPRPFALAFLRPVGLLPVRWWQARIIRPFRRLVQPCLQLRDPTLRRGKPDFGQFKTRPKRMDQRVFLGMR